MRACKVVSDEVVAEERPGVEVVAFAKFVDEGCWCQALVHHEIDLPRGVEVECGGWSRCREDVDGLESDIFRIPIFWVLLQSHAVEEAPFLEEVGPVANESGCLCGPVRVFLHSPPVDREIGGKSAKIEEVGGRIFECHPKGASIDDGYSHGFGIVVVPLVERSCIGDRVEL